MINDLVEFGNWLIKEELDGFGENIRDTDYIFEINYRGNEFHLGNITQKKEYKKHFYKDSAFNKDLYHTTTQSSIIPSNSNLLGFTPFLIKLDINSKLEKKIDRSLKANLNGKDFTEVANKIIPEYKESYLDKCSFNTKEYGNLKYFFENVTLTEVENLIAKYYQFLQDNLEVLTEKVQDFKKTEGFEKRSNFYLLCVFEDKYDLINDFFYYYSKFLILRDKRILDFDYGTCSICGSKGVTYPSLECFAFRPETSFNYHADLLNSKLHLCRKCNSSMVYAISKLKNIMGNNYLMVIPKSKNNNSFKSFLKIANVETNKFDILNRFLIDNSNDFNFDLMIYQKENVVMSIKKYITNYKAFLVKFEDLYLYDGGKLNYLFKETLSKEDIEEKNQIRNYFDLEPIFKEFFYDINDDGNFKFPNLWHFYEIFTKDISGKTGIFSGFDSNITSIFITYMNNIFDFIYELNPDALNKKMINEIVSNSIIGLEKNSTIKKDYYFNKIKQLNYYFMLKKEFMGDKMLSDENVKSLKGILGQENKDKTIKIDYNAVDKILETDPACKYFLLGQFIKLIDDTKRSSDKKPIVFNNFISNVNRNNIRKIFVTEILQKNNFYIQKMNKKGKYVFSMLEKDIDSIFNEETGFDYEDYVLLLFTGYYTTNILNSGYVYKGDE